MEKTMKIKLVLFLITLLTVFACNSKAQQIDKITRKCPSSNLYSAVLVDNTGDITHRPCGVRSSIFYGNVNLTNATVNFGLTNTRFPIANATGGITNSPYSFIGGEYIWQNSTLNAGWRMRFTPSDNASLGGQLTIGDNGSGVSTGLFLGSNDTPIFTAQTLGFGLTVDGLGTQVELGDILNVGNATKLVIFDNPATFTFSTADASTSQINANQISYWYFYRTITPGGTTGTVTINRPYGTVNIAAGGSSITVNNNVAATDSLIFTTLRTNDATCAIKNVVSSPAQFIITMTAPCTGQVSIGFNVTN